MPNVTLDFCRDVLNLRDEDLDRRGGRLVTHVWSRCPMAVHQAIPAPVRGLASRIGSGQLGPVERVAFLNTLSFVNAQRPEERDTDLRPLAAMVFSATALADARGLSCGELNRAVGVGLEAHLRLLSSIEGPEEASDFDWHVVAGTFSAIVACGLIEELTAEELNTAVGLGGSVVTAAACGYQPLQMAMAAQDAITMVRLAASGFLSPPDVLACRWGVFDAFSGNRRENRHVLMRRAGGSDVCAKVHRMALPRNETPVRDFISRVGSTAQDAA